MGSSRQLEIQTEDQTPNKWNVSLTEEVFKRFMMQGNPTVQKVFGDGSLFSPLLFGKFFDPSDAFPLWEFESDVLLSNLRMSSKTNVDWFQTDDAYVLKSDLPGMGINTVRVYAENGKIVEISGQWKQQSREWKAKDWRSGHWWEHGYVRRLELPEDADCRKIEACVCSKLGIEAGTKFMCRKIVQVWLAYLAPLIGSLTEWRSHLASSSSLATELRSAHRAYL